MTQRLYVDTTHNVPPPFPRAGFKKSKLDSTVMITLSLTDSKQLPDNDLSTNSRNSRVSRSGWIGTKRVLRRTSTQTQATAKSATNCFSNFLS